MQKLRPREVDVLTYLNGAHMTFGASSPTVRFFIAHWKGIIEEIHFGGSIMPLVIIENLDP